MTELIDRMPASQSWLGLPPTVVLFFLLIVSVGARGALGQLSFEGAPINYNTTPVDDPVAQLQQQIDQNQVKLEYDNEHGYLRSVLEHLAVPASSQMLVFSKTSFQRNLISPHSPRAIYFGDQTYVGWVPGGHVLEISTVDPQLGAVFYTLGQRASEAPKFVRDKGECLVCHASSKTAGVPGHLVRSVFSDRDGFPILGAGTFTTDHSSPLKERWGGWYVSGTHGKQRHMGNVVVQNEDQVEQFDMEAGANRTDLSDRINTSAYLTPHSDIAALMVLEHQTQMHNLITRANYEGKITLRNEKLMNQLLERPADHLGDSAKRRIESAGDRLLQYLLFVDEVELAEPLKGTSGFAEEFSARGPRDQRGRSLYELDLTKRLLKYPCSYLIYSKSFDQLVQPMRDYVYRRLWEVLRGDDESDTFSHLAAADRRAVLEILQDTKAGLPDYWHQQP